MIVKYIYYIKTVLFIRCIKGWKNEIEMKITSIVGILDILYNFHTGKNNIYIIIK